MDRIDDTNAVITECHRVIGTRFSYKCHFDVKMTDAHDLEKVHFLVVAPISVFIDTNIGESGVDKQR